MRPQASSPNELRLCHVRGPTAASSPGCARSTERSVARAEVAVEVAAVQRRQPRVAHDVAAGDRAEAVAAVRLARAPGGAAPRAARVAPGRRACPRSTPSRSWRRARRRSPRTASWPTSPITSWPVARSNENRHGLRSPTRHDLRRRRGRVEPDQLAEQRRRVLRVAELVVAAAAVARRQPQLPVGPELQLPAVVVLGLVVRDREQQPPGRRVGDVGRPPSAGTRAPGSRRRSRSVARRSARRQVRRRSPGAKAHARAARARRPSDCVIEVRSRNGVASTVAVADHAAPARPARSRTAARRHRARAVDVGRRGEVADLAPAPAPPARARRARSAAPAISAPPHAHPWARAASRAPPMPAGLPSSCTRRSPRAGTRSRPSPSARRRGSRRPPASRGGSSPPARSTSPSARWRAPAMRPASHS